MNTTELLKKKLKRLFAKSGYGFCKWNCHTIPSMRSTKLMTSNQIGTVFDVGANTGGYATGLRMNGYTGKILSIEPYSEAHQILTKTSADDPAWIVLNPCAVGEKNESLQLNCASNSESSSLLDFTDAHREAAPSVVMVGHQIVQVRRLDEVVKEYEHGFESGIMLKLDVQGYEMKALLGAAESLNRFSLIQLEVSIKEMYSGECDWITLVTFLRDREFYLANAIPVIHDKLTGSVLQWDMLFENRM